MLTKAAFDPETVSLLGAVLEQAIAALPPDDRSQERKTLLASKILSAASAGERDPVRLQAAALAVGPYGAIAPGHAAPDISKPTSRWRARPSAAGVPDDRVFDRLIRDCPQIASGIRHRNVLRACRLYHHPVCPNGRVRPSPVGISPDPTVLPGLTSIKGHRRAPA